MKLKGFYSIISVLVIIVFSHCDDNESVIPRDEATFIHLYGGEFQDKGIDICALPDGRLAILASTTETSAITGEESDHDIVIILTDTLGKSSELYTLGKRSVDESPSSMLYHEGNLYIAGTTDDLGDNDFLFLKFSLASSSMTSYIPIGDSLINETCYDNAVLENVSGENNTSFSGIIMVGESDSVGGGYQASYDIWVTFEGDSIGRNQANGVLLNGRTKSVVAEPGNFRYTFIAEEDSASIGQSIVIASNAFSNGRRSRSKEYLAGFNGFNYADKILSVSSETTYLIDSYNSISGSPNVSDAVGIYTRRNGQNLDPISTIVIDTLNMVVTDIYRTVENNGLLLGTNSQNGTIKLVKFDFNINEVVWTREFGTNEEFDEAGSVIQLADGKIFFTAAVSFQRGESNTKIALYKTTADGKLDF